MSRSYFPKILLSSSQEEVDQLRKQMRELNARKVVNAMPTFLCRESVLQLFLFFASESTARLLCRMNPHPL